MNFARTFCISIIFCASVVLACPQADLTGDCIVRLDDLAIFAEQWLDPAGCTGYPDNCADFVGNDGVRLEDLAVLAAQWGVNEAIPVVINEIHYNPDLSYELVEFIELYNAGDEAIDLSGWYFSKGVSYTFPPGTTLAAGEFIVVTEDASRRTISPTTTVAQKYGISSELVYGPFGGHLSNEGETIELRASTGIEVDQVDYQLGFPWPTVGDEIPEESYGNGHSMQLVNANFDNDLGGNWRSAFPTPAAANIAVAAANAPSCIRQVQHTPQQPKAGEVVTLTAKITDADGIDSVWLSYQIVNPGDYIKFTDSRYTSQWFTPPDLEMHDDGINGDEYAGDNVYTVQIPASYQVNRRLIRFRIIVIDALDTLLSVPYEDDPQPNFAYFVYDGVPAWTGANQPGVTAAVQFGTDVMRSLPVYHLIAIEEDVLKSQYNSSYGNTRFYGTLVYDGVVYDHIEYKIRGEASTYVSGKNKWRLFFTRGHDFIARDDYGDKYNTSWKVMNLSALAVPWVAPNRGMAIDEALAFALYNLAGVPSSKTNFLQFRIIDDSVEVNPSDQYDGDLWGLYMTIEYPDGRFLDEHGLPDGNTYKMESVPEKKNQGPTQCIDDSDVIALRIGDDSNTLTWWEQNVNLERYYAFRAINRAVNNMDLRDNYNIYHYHNPVTDLWTVIPWDLDMLYVSDSHIWPGTIEFENCLNHQEFLIAYKNRGREIQDLLLNADQLGQLVDELSAIVNPQGQPLTMTDVDQFMWNYHPRTTAAHKGHFYKNPDDYDHGWSSPRILVSADHEGMAQWLKDFLLPAPSGGSSPSSYGANFLESEVADSDIPNTPTVIYTGSAGFPENDLTFECSAFNDPQGAQTFAAMKWRIAEVEAFSQSVIPSGSGGGTVVLIAADAEWNYFKGTAEPSNPVTEWRQLSFNDSGWLSGGTPLGYGATVTTELSDMRDNYTSVYLRKEFQVNNPADIEQVHFSINYDEGFNIWINGTHLDSVNVSGAEVPYYGTASGYISGQTSIELTYTNPGDFLVSGTNIIAVQLLNHEITSSDCLFDPVLEADLVETPGTSGGYDFVYTGTPGKYEIDTVWESSEITTYSNTIRIPADGVKAGRTYRVRCKMKDDTGRWSHWSDPNQFVAGEAINADILDYLRVSEVMYNNGDADFIELKNIGTTTLDLSDVSITDGVDFGFGGSDVNTLAPGEFVLVIKDQAAFEALYGSSLNGKIAGAFVDSSLSNSGETVKIEDTWNGTIIEFEYNDARGWPLAADGAGHSLVPLESAIEEQPLGTLDFGGNWRQSTYIGGSPGADDPTLTTSVMINEFMAHTDYSNPSYPDYDSNDWIELYNAGASSESFDGNWYLSDDPSNLKKWTLPSSTLNAGSWVSYDEITGFHNPITSGFGLDKAGEQIFLSYLPGTSADRVVDCIRFKGQENDVSLSRYPDGGDYWLATSPDTQNAANANPVNRVVISEIMYHPLADTETQTYDEYIEIYNPTGSSVDLWTTTGPWAIDGGIDYEFPASTTLSNGDRILVVDFDPFTETARLDAFEAAYSTGELTAGVDIFGPWSGDLSNNGERVTLEKPQDSDDPLDPSAISWIIVDECIYNDYWPWPIEPDGMGDALKRLSSAANASGNDAANWTALAPTPGS